MGVRFSHPRQTEKTISSDSSIRINRYICQSGICSRKSADAHVALGVVLINGRQALPGDQVLSGDKVSVNGQLVKPLAEKDVIFIALNKPVGVVCTAAASDNRNIVDFVGRNSRIYPIGRLDKDSQGLIFLTNKSDLVNKILCSDNHHEKEYVVTVDKKISDAFISGMSAGVPVLGVVTKNCKVAKESQYVFRIILTQGLNRQIRRMCKHFNYSVNKLERVRILNITLGELPVGQSRDFTNEERLKLYKALETVADNNPASHKI